MYNTESPVVGLTKKKNNTEGIQLYMESTFSVIFVSI